MARDALGGLGNFGAGASPPIWALAPPDTPWGGGGPGPGTNYVWVGGLGNHIGHRLNNYYTK